MTAGRAALVRRGLLLNYLTLAYNVAEALVALGAGLAAGSVALAGVALNAVADWWWADPVAALAMVPIIAKEGIDGVRGRPC